MAFRLKDLMEHAGLRVINGIARSVAFERYVVPFGNHGRQAFDWYCRDGDRARPTVIFYYGGNWQSGRRRDYQFVADTMLAAGFNVVVPDYRLYPEVRFEAMLDDAVAALACLHELLPDEVPVCIAGHSAGAQLGALVTLDRELLPSAARDRLKGFVGLAGPYDFFPFTEDDHWDLFGPESRYPRSQPVNFVRSDAPPLYLLHGENDLRVRRGHSKSLMEKQLDAGGDASREVYEAMGHVDIIVSFSRLHRRNSRVVADMTRFLASRLGGYSPTNGQLQTLS